jgi:hypothetical protein
LHSVHAGGQPSNRRQSTVGRLPPDIRRHRGSWFDGRSAAASPDWITKSARSVEFLHLDVRPRAKSLRIAGRRDLSSGLPQTTMDLPGAACDPAVCVRGRDHSRNLSSAELGHSIAMREAACSRSAR